MLRGLPVPGQHLNDAVHGNNSDGHVRNSALNPEQLREHPRAAGHRALGLAVNHLILHRRAHGRHLRLHLLLRDHDRGVDPQPLRLRAGHRHVTAESDRLVHHLKRDLLHLNHKGLNQAHPRNQRHFTHFQHIRLHNQHLKREYLLDPGHNNERNLDADHPGPRRGKYPPVRLVR